MGVLLNFAPFPFLKNSSRTTLGSLLREQTKTRSETKKKKKKKKQLTLTYYPPTLLHPLPPPHDPSTFPPQYLQKALSPTKNKPQLHHNAKTHPEPPKWKNLTFSILTFSTWDALKHQSIGVLLRTRREKRRGVEKKEEEERREVFFCILRGGGGGKVGVRKVEGGKKVGGGGTFDLVNGSRSLWRDK